MTLENISAIYTDITSEGIPLRTIHIACPVWYRPRWLRATMGLNTLSSQRKRQISIIYHAKFNLEISSISHKITFALAPYCVWWYEVVIESAILVIQKYKTLAWTYKKTDHDWADLQRTMERRVLRSLLKGRNIYFLSFKKYIGLFALRKIQFLDPNL